MELNWHERIGEKQVISRREQDESGREVYKNEKRKCKACKSTVVSWLNMLSYDAFSSVGEWGERDCMAFQLTFARKTSKVVYFTSLERRLAVATPNALSRKRFH